MTSLETLFQGNRESWDFVQVRRDRQPFAPSGRPTSISLTADLTQRVITCERWGASWDVNHPHGAFVSVPIMGQGVRICACQLPGPGFGV